MKKAKLQDIADRAGVARSTVDRALHGRSRVNVETRDKILRIARELDYHPDLRGRALKMSSSFLVGMVVPNITQSFYADVVQGTEEYLEKAGYGLMLCNIIGEECTPRYVSMLERHQVDGIISCAEVKHGWNNGLRELASKGFPAVMINFRVDGVDGPVVFVNQRKGGYLAAMRLIEVGHRRIMFLGGSHDYLNDERLWGYKSAMDEAGIPVSPEFIVSMGDWTTDEFDAKVGPLLKDKSTAPTAAFAVYDMAAFRLISWLRGRDIQVPHNFSVVGFDDLPSLTWFAPCLTTVKQKKKEMGYAAAELLIKRLGGEELKDVLLDVELVERDTVAPPDCL